MSIGWDLSRIDGAIAWKILSRGVGGDASLPKEFVMFRGYSPGGEDLERDYSRPAEIRLHATEEDGVAARGLAPFERGHITQSAEPCFGQVETAAKPA